ncbi:MAG: hypothetical protein WA705_22830 [Candidatus Ozemobacteraceae bacterium]
MSEAVDKLWISHIRTMWNIRKETTDPLPVFGRDGETRVWSTTGDKDAIIQKLLFSKEQLESSPYRRLKMVMDYWCSLWFWPILEVEKLPSREEFLLELTALLEGEIPVDFGEPVLQPSLPGVGEEKAKQGHMDFRDDLGRVNSINSAIVFHDWRWCGS